MNMRMCCGLILACVTAGCSVEQNDSGAIDAQLHNPFVAEQWEVKTQSRDTGTCVLTSGYQGIDVVLQKSKGRKLVGSVESTRRIEPGNFLRVSIGGHMYETSAEAFSARDSAAIIEDLKTGDKAYVTWNNIQTAHGKRRVSKIVQPSNFTARYNECKRLK